jgi:hypothetical protein
MHMSRRKTACGAALAGFISLSEEVAMAQQKPNATLEWTDEDAYWRNNYKQRPYAGSNAYDYWQPAYRYGYESAQKYHGKNWEDVESDLRSGWDRYEHRGTSTWENVKGAVRDAWDRMFHRG